MLGIIASNVPCKPETTSLVNEIKVSRNDIPNYLMFMEKASNMGKHNVEVSGKNKGPNHVEDVDNAYIVRDDPECASGQFLSLWRFGLLF